MKSQLGIAWIGVGRWGRNLVRVFSEVPRGRPVAICDVDPGALARVRESGWSGTLTLSLEPVLSDPQVDAVVIATPPASHVPVALACLEARKHIFVEKPLALSTRDAWRVERAARLSARRVMVGHVLLFHALVRHLHSLIRSGELGQIEHISSHRLTCSAREENAWWTLGAHEVSVLGFLLDAEPCSVSVRAVADAPHRADDAVRARLVYAETTADVLLSCVHPERCRRLVVVGSKQTAVLSDDPGTGLLSLFETGASPERLLRSIRGDGSPEPLRVEAEHFVDAVLSGNPIATDVVHGVGVVDILERGGESLVDAGRAVTVRGAPDRQIAAFG